MSDWEKLCSKVWNKERTEFTKAKFKYFWKLFTYFNFLPLFDMFKNFIKGAANYSRNEYDNAKNKINEETDLNKNCPILKKESKNKSEDHHL